MINHIYDLTIGQVREAGRNAVHEDEDIEWWPATRGIVVYSWTGNDLPQPDDIPPDGWHHVSGCDCEFCHETGTKSATSSESRPAILCAESAESASD